MVSKPRNVFAYPVVIPGHSSLCYFYPRPTTTGDVQSNARLRREHLVESRCYTVSSPSYAQSLSNFELILYSLVFSQMFSPTIMLLIGGFTIASALSKTNIDRVLITRVLSLAGTRPSTVLLAFMGVSCFASMWIRCEFRACLQSSMSWS